MELRLELIKRESAQDVHFGTPRDVNDLQVVGVKESLDGISHVPVVGERIPEGRSSGRASPGLLLSFHGCTLFLAGFRCGFLRRPFWQSPSGC